MIEIVDRSTVPDTGYWRRGSVAVNNDFSAGEPVFWLCTVSGEPGTWIPFYTNVPSDIASDMTVDELIAAVLRPAAVYGLSANFSTIPADRSVSVPTGTQVAIFGTFTVDGTLTVDGEMRVCGWPS